jgi:hypothetical protein
MLDCTLERNSYLSHMTSSSTSTGLVPLIDHNQIRLLHARDADVNICL